MSLNRTDVYASPGILIPEISQNLSTQNASISSLTSTRIFLDGNTLDTTGSGASASILLNGVVVAGNTGLTSSIANWAQFGANSTITFATGGGSGGSMIMCNVSTQQMRSGLADFTALTVSSINGQKVNQIGQVTSYRGNAYLSTNRINVDNKVSTLFTFSNFVGNNIQGEISIDFQGNVNSSNDGTIPISVLYVTDVAVGAGYGTGSAPVPQFVDFSMFGIGKPAGSGSNAVAVSATIPFAFSNAGSVLQVVLSEQAMNPEGFTPLYTWTAGGTSLSTNWVAVTSGGVISNDP